MSQYICKTEGLICDECGALIPVGASFIVVTTPSKPYKNTCTVCSGGILGERYAREDNPGEVALRAVETKNRALKRREKESQIREEIERDLTERRNRANIERT